MKPLQVIKRVLTWLCGVPPNKSDEKREKIQYILLTFIVILIHLLSVISSAVFIYRHVSIDLEEILFCLFHTASSFQVLYLSIATVLLRRRLIVVLDSLANIYAENQNGDLFHLLKNTDKICEWMWQIYFKYFMISYIVNAVIFTTVSVLFSHITYGHFEIDHVYHPLKYVLPWNQSTCYGYALEIGFGLAVAESHFLSNGSLFILFISMCLHHRTFYKIFQNESSKLDYRDNKRSNAEHLRKMIRFHNMTKDWFLDSAKTYSAFVLIILFSSMLYLSCSVFQINLQMKHPDFRLYMLSVATAVGMSNLFIYCFFGKMATESYEKMADCLYDCNWYELGRKYQKYFVIIMTNAQRPIYYHGFGVAVLHLQTFIKMIRTVLSYYMLFKTLTSD